MLRHEGLTFFGTPEALPEKPALPKKAVEVLINCDVIFASGYEMRENWANLFDTILANEGHISIFSFGRSSSNEIENHLHNVLRLPPALIGHFAVIHHPPQNNNKKENIKCLRDWSIQQQKVQAIMLVDADEDSLTIGLSLDCVPVRATKNFFSKFFLAFLSCAVPKQPLDELKIPDWPRPGFY